MALKMTPARLALLRAVSNRAVTLYAGGDSYRDDVSPGRRCNDQIWPLWRAGLVQRPMASPDGAPWRLTDDGRAALDGGLT